MVLSLFARLMAVIGCPAVVAALLAIGLGRLPIMDGDALAFYSRRSGNYEIYVTDAERGLTANLTRHPANDVRPAWSPDGERLIFLSDREKDMGLYLIDLTERSTRHLVEAGGSEAYPAWSPDGRWIAYSSEQRRQDEVQKIGIYLIEAACLRQVEVCGKQAIQLTQQRTALLVWSPDGRLLTYMADCDSNCDLYVMDMTCAASCDSSARRITRNGIFDVFPVWSPDGQQIAFMSNRDRFFELYRVDLDCAGAPGNCEANTRRLTENRVFDGFPVWSPDGRLLLFSSDRDGNFELYTLEAACSTAASCLQTTRRLTSSESRDLSPAWSPDGRRIAFVSGRDIYVMDGDGSHPRRLLSDVLPDQFLAWRPDAALKLP